jgi:hypothetical protein
MDLDCSMRSFENSNTATIPPDPDLRANKLSGDFVKGPCDFHVTVTMNVAASFLEAWKLGKRVCNG